MVSAKVISLTVRAYQVSHLCFEVGGILESLNVQKNRTTLLGQIIASGEPLTPFNFEAFYSTLGAFPIHPGIPPLVPPDPSRLRYGVSEIQSFVATSTLATLRAEPAKIALNMGMNDRQNAYFAKYGNAAGIVAKTNEYYSLSVSDSKPARLATLRTLSEEQADKLSHAYSTANPPRTGVVKTTQSVLTSTTQSSGTSTEVGQSNEESLSASGSGTAPNLPAAGGQFHGNEFSGPATLDLQEGSSSDGTNSTGSASETQTILNTDYGYRIPYIENQAQHQRAQISLMDQQFAQFMFGQNLANLEQVFQNELSNINNNVFRLQVGYLNTILMSPMSGIVTGVYKNPGDAVYAGEPVIRVEDVSIVYVVGTLIYQGPIALGSTATITTTLFGLSGVAPIQVQGTVVVVRGQSQEDQWSIVVECFNGSNANPTIPPGYHFDYDDTTITFA
jgi:biotin carboxyl carrier protein